MGAPGGMRHAPASAAVPSSVPVSVPHLVLDVHDDGTLTATLDTRPVDPPDGVSWRRAMFAQIIDHATGDRTIAVRVTVHESDGTTFTDILPAAKRPAPEPVAEEKSEPRRAIDVSVGCPIRYQWTGDGFIAEEDVAVALIAAHTDATPDEAHGPSSTPHGRSRHGRVRWCWSGGSPARSPMRSLS